VKLDDSNNNNNQKKRGIVKALTDVCLKLPEGKYLLLKDPNRAQMRLYQIPNNAFEVDEVVPEDEVASANVKRETVLEDDEDF